MELLDLKPRQSSFVIKIKGREKRLFLRPFVLRDEAWLQENWDNTNLVAKIADRDVHTIVKIIWNQMTPKSKKIVMNIKATYIDVDPQTGENLIVNPEGHLRLIEFLDIEGLNNALSAWLKVRGLNSLSVDEADKKKAIKLTGVKSLILYLLNIVTPTSKSSA